MSCVGGIMLMVDVSNVILMWVMPVSPFSCAGLHNETKRYIVESASYGFMYSMTFHTNNKHYANITLFLMT